MGTPPQPEGSGDGLGVRSENARGEDGGQGCPPHRRDNGRRQEAGRHDGGAAARRRFARRAAGHEARPPAGGGSEPTEGQATGEPRRRPPGVLL